MCPKVDISEFVDISVFPQTKRKHRRDFWASPTWVSCLARSWREAAGVLKDGRMLFCEGQQLMGKPVQNHGKLVGGLEHFFFHILGKIIPIDQYFSEGLKPPTRKSLILDEKIQGLN